MIHLSLIIPDVDGSGLSSLRTVVLEHKMEQNLLISNEVAPANNMYHMYGHHTIVIKHFLVKIEKSKSKN